jgi:pyruvate dehydrogenase E2 component (dihydrolipoamide acetyltransferase)
MTEGTIVAWQVEPGTAVAAGDTVLVVSTDKVEAEVEAPAGGILEALAAVGETLPCGAVLGRLMAPTNSHVRRPISPNASRVARTLGVDLAGVDGTGPDGRITSEDVERIHAAAPPASSVPPAPAAARPPQLTPTGTPATASFSHMAAATSARLGLDVTSVPGSGPGGCVTRDDVYAHARRLLQDTAHLGGSMPQSDPATVVPFTGMRRVIAQRMHTSLTEMAQLTIGMDVAFDRVEALRTELAKASDDFRRPRPTYTDFVVAAVARALPDHPRLNSRLTEAGIELSPAVHLGIAVALDNGLVVPVLRHADRLNLFDVAARSRALVESARAGTLGIDDLEGATFCVTSLGKYGVDFFTPVVNPPNAAILGVGRIRTETRWRDHRPEPGQVVPLSLTWDHRLLDGVPAAQFLQRVAHLLEHPSVLLS